MAVILTDDLGNAIPQYNNENGSGFEQWKGARGHGNVRSDDGEITSIGSTGDEPAASPDANASVIALLKALLAKPTGAGGPTGERHEKKAIWSNVSPSVGGMSTSVDVDQYEMFAVMGESTGPMTISVDAEYGSYYPIEIIEVDGPFYVNIQACTSKIALRMVENSGSYRITAKMMGRKR